MSLEGVEETDLLLLARVLREDLLGSKSREGSGISEKEEEEVEGVEVNEEVDEEEEMELLEMELESERSNTPVETEGRRGESPGINTERSKAARASCSV